MFWEINLKLVFSGQPCTSNEIVAVLAVTPGTVRVQGLFLLFLLPLVRVLD